MIKRRQKQIKVSSQKITSVVSLMLIFLCVLEYMILNMPIISHAATILEASSQEDTTGVITDIDLGDYNATMSVGEKQRLYITLLPQAATSQTINYASDNESVATINALGRISAVSAGITKITVSCGSIAKSFELTVKESAVSTEVKVNVTDIEISEYKEELEVDKTLNLTATVLPSTATDSKIIYSTSNAAIATVSSTGVIKGIAPGTVDITLSAGGFSKKISLLVKMATSSIELNTNYLVLKNGDTYQLNGKAVPEQAKQTITYKSADERIASVTSDGKVTARDIGNTTILVSNGDMTNAVTVIVNASDIAQTTVAMMGEDSAGKTTNLETAFINLLSKNDQIEINVNEYSVITSAMLKNLYESAKRMIIKTDDYIMVLDGKDIVNCNNELATGLTLTKTENGMELVLNDSQNLPGIVSVQMTNGNQYKYLYLYNAGKGKYENIKVDNLSVIRIDTAGKYMLTEKKLNGISLSLLVVLGFATIVIILSGVYIVVKKKHWFW